MVYFIYRLYFERYYIYYSKFDKGQTFKFVCRRSCLFDIKNFKIDM